MRALMKALKTACHAGATLDDLRTKFPSHSDEDIEAAFDALIENHHLRRELRPANYGDVFWARDPSHGVVSPAAQGQTVPLRKHRSVSEQAREGASSSAMRPGPPERPTAEKRLSPADPKLRQPAPEEQASPGTLLRDRALVELAAALRTPSTLLDLEQQLGIPWAALEYPVQRLVKAGLVTSADKRSYNPSLLGRSYVINRSCAREVNSAVKALDAKDHEGSERSGTSPKWDAFISHASEDKDDFVRPLVTSLRRRRLSVWYDEFELRVGHSLSREIDRGMDASACGILVLSPAFLERKGWTDWEMQGIIDRHVNDEAVILPVLYRLTPEAVRRHSPALANIWALKAEAGVGEVAKALAQRIRTVRETT